jgi:DNA repair exonuclease SbcCD nuclease subunit
VGSRRPTGVIEMTTVTDATHAPHTVRILHTSDWQLGMDRWFLGEEAGPRYREARLSVIERLLTLAGERDCDAVVVAGDVFDDNLVDDRTWRRAVDILRAATVPTFLLPGNHDPYDPASIYRSPEFAGLAPMVRVLTDSTPLTVPGTALQIIGAPLLSKYMSTDPVGAALRDLRDRDGDRSPGGRVRVLVGHGATSSRSSSADPATIDVAAAAAACRDRTVDFIALGDTHSATCLHPDGTVWYSGSPEPTDFREEDGGGEGRSGRALVIGVTVDPAAPTAPATVDVEEVEVGSWHFLALAAQIDSDEDVTDWVHRLEALPDKRTTVVKYALTGTVDLTTGARLEQEMIRLAPSFAALYERERLMDLHTAPGDDELAEADWPGAVGEAARDLAARTRDGEDVARDALRLLYRLSVKEA